ncbi:hypothetical protein SSBR45G_18500 [Bradyrhizobium sp. SSBR45G]|uniref:DUF4339 domain-containing protein n=1 Tax=unclassified Bradyrhizobium TaxID=2631580 RepID=UPI00234298EC|nr:MULTISPECIES: DUF4339 domain-containing protein [unclassified Bradyrhizobium]GLH76942.1 hypothetical protein SSBR45G_18500 [Bradyrhizobium sp. SSBR45G]GLH83700.1 hypothetical protein SSBR45R_11600 [Bradyrhizobium sp. SSBR45R]
MSIRSWYYAAQGQQQGPVSEDDLRDLIARGVVSAETLLWSDGMAGWEKAGRIPGLMSGVPSISPGGPPAFDGGGSAATGPLSAKLDTWSYLGWTLLYVLGQFLIVIAPWTAVYLYRYVIERIRVPGRPNLSFIGQPLDIWYVFVGMGVLTYVGMSDQAIIKLAAIIAQAFLGWMIMRWVMSRIASNGEPLPIRFEGSPIVYFGWYLLLIVSGVTIIGWAWVATAWMRWICRNIQGTRREVVFNGTGLQVLWRTLVFVLGCSVIIPIPWLLRWYSAWYVSQFALVPRGSQPV